MLPTKFLSLRHGVGLPSASRIVFEWVVERSLEVYWGAFSSPCHGVVWDSINLSSHVSSPSRVVNWNDDGFVLNKWSSLCSLFHYFWIFAILLNNWTQNLNFGARKLAWLDSLSRWWEVGWFCVWFAPIFHGRCCWLRPQMMEPEVFSPAELGMEGAKLAAIRRRRHGKENPPVLSWIKAGCWQDGEKTDRILYVDIDVFILFTSIHFSPVLIDVFFPVWARNHRWVTDETSDCALGRWRHNLRRQPQCQWKFSRKDGEKPWHKSQGADPVTTSRWGERSATLRDLKAGRLDEVVLVHGERVIQLIQSCTIL